MIKRAEAEGDLSDLDLVVAGTADAIVMVEAGAREVDEKIVLDGLDAAHNAIKQICAVQNELRNEIGKPKGQVAITPRYTEELLNEMMKNYGPARRLAMLTQGKQARPAAAK